MKQTCTYNIPLSLIDAYKGRQVILRAADPVGLAKILSSQQRSQVILVQLLDVSADLEPLSDCGSGIPIEIVLNDPQREAAKLYRITKLQRAHPVRIVIPVVVGFGKAVKVASSLHLPIKLEGTQPQPSVIDEICSTLDFFLHHKAVSQPIEYFTGILIALLHDFPITLWDVQEEDPAVVRYITDDGHEVVARKPYFSYGGDLDSFRREFIERMGGQGECASCEFFSNCAGYFKWPDPEFSCDGIKSVLGRLRDSAKDLEKDLASYSMILENAS